MGTFGKYVIMVTCQNGEKGFFQCVDDGYIILTKSAYGAERFVTASGARGFASGIDWDLPTFGEDYSYVSKVDLMVKD